MLANGPTRRLHLLHLASAAPVPSGSAVQMLEAAAGLASRGHRLTVITRAAVQRLLPTVDPNVARFSLPLRHELDFGSMRRLARFAQRHDVRVIHTHDRVAHAVALGAKALGGHWVLVVNRATSFPIGPATRWCFRSRKVAKIVAVCQAVRDLTIRTGHVEPGKVVVIPGSVDVQRFDPRRTRPAAVRTELGLPPAARVIGHTGMHDWKGWREVLAALPIVRAAFPEAHLLLVGCRSDRQREWVLQLAGEMELAGAVTVTLARTDMQDVLSCCEVVVDPSWAGTAVSGTVREAMALGKPVVATSIAGNPELVEDGTTGLLVPPRDHTTLAAAIARLLRDIELARRLAATGQERVRVHFSSERRAERLEHLYLHLLAEPASPHPR